MNIRIFNGVMMDNKDLSYLLDRNSDIPLYKQVESIIKQLLDAEPYKSGAYLPGENELITQMGVARHTIRYALKELTSKGFITRERGKGTKKTQRDNKIHTNIRAWSSFTDEMNEQGHDTKLKLVQTNVKIPPIEISEYFGTDKALPFLLRKYGLSNNSHPDLFFESYFHPYLNLENDEDFLEYRFVKLYDFLRSKCGIIATSSQERIEVVNSSRVDNIELDGIPQNFSLIKRTRIVLDQNDRCFEYNIGYYNPDVFVLHFKSTNNTM